MRRPGIRTRLTLWYGLSSAMLVTGFGTAAYLMMRAYVLEQADAEVAEELAEFAWELRSAEDSTAFRERLPAFFDLHRSYSYAVATASGEPILAAGRPSVAPLPGVQSGEVEFDTRDKGDAGRFRVGSKTVETPGGTFRIAIAVPLASDDRLLNRLAVVLFGVGPLAVTAAIGGGYLLARRAMSPVAKMRTEAKRITAERLDLRIDLPNTDDELARLAETFNAMLERLDESFGEMRRFTADAAHELRTPLAVLRTGIEVTLRAPRSSDRYQTALQSALDDVERLCRLAERLLTLARLDAGAASPMRIVPLDVVVARVVRRWSASLEEAGVTIATELEDRLDVIGDEDRLDQLVTNLVENAVKYTPPGGRVSVRGWREGEAAQLVVEDKGCGIPAEHIGRVFERFYRADSSRDGRTGGAGLGLAICRSIVTAHTGEISLESSPGNGTRLIVTLPAAARACEDGSALPDSAGSSDMTDPRLATVACQA